ncbi:MAG: YkvA family protein [Cyclobacteriaceae bacterium]
MDSKEKDQNIFEKVKTIYMDRAIHIAACDQKVRKLVDKVSRKWKEVSQNPAFAEVKFQLEVFIRMIKSHLNKKYSGLSNRTLGLLVLGLFYFALPLDLVPDFIPFVGYVDDITVLLAIFKSIQSDIALFLEWEKNQI